ncbi:MAG: hypothetical protein PWQ87_64 [Candidatus Woesearchaeota archaeon]|nr:hypothetical protein [Candidatus Woesearchaeota archaeon]
MKFRTLLMAVVLLGFLLSFVLSVEVVEACNFDSDCPPNSYCDGNVAVHQTYYCLDGYCVVDEETTTTCTYGCSGGECNECTPSTCSELGVECGTVSDGCGGTLDCGGCYSSQPYCHDGQCVECTSSSHCDSEVNYCAGEVSVTGYEECRNYACHFVETSREDCNDYDGYACGSGNKLEERNYYCIPGGCDYKRTSSKDCDDYDGIYCNGDIRESRDYSCTGAVGSASCTYSLSWSDNCALYSGDYCKDASTKEYRTYTCSGGSCTYTSSNVESCGTDGCYGGEYINHYCSNGNCYSETLDGDDSSTYCSCCSSCKWNIGGEVSATTCCGDDGSEYVCGGVGDNTLDYSYQDPDLDDKACCLSSTDCVYNNVCYPSNSQGPSVDHDSDPDWCGYPGTWRDCNTDAQCGGGAIFGDYEVCVNNNCTVSCYNQPCIAGNSTCYNEVSGETLYCMNSTSFASQSSYVENPIGGEDRNERYCRQDEYYDPVVDSCRLKYGEDICYNYLDSDPNICGTGNTASVVYCNLVGEYCSFDTRKNEKIVVIKSADAPRNVVGKGPKSPTTSLGECIETDYGDKPKEWGCVYTMYAENNNDGNEENGQIDDDFQFVNVEMGCDQVSDGKLIEFYCSGGEILAKEYTCEKIITTEDNTSYCFKTPSDSRTVTPPKKDHPINKP